MVDDIEEVEEVFTWNKKEEKRLVQLYINTKRLEYGFNTMSKNNIIKIWMMDTLLLKDEISERFMQTMYNKELEYYDSFVNSGIIEEERIGDSIMIHLNPENEDVKILNGRFNNIESKRIMNKKIEFDKGLMSDFMNININNVPDDVLRVLSSDGSEYYYVNKTKRTCTCLGFTYRQYCKHLDL